MGGGERTCYFGQEEELRRLAGALSAEGRDGGRRYFILNGPARSGKRTFVARLWERLQQDGTPRVFAPVDAGWGRQRLAGQVFSAMTGNRPELLEGLGRLREQYEGEEADSASAAGGLLAGLIEQALIGKGAGRERVQLVWVLLHADNLWGETRAFVRQLLELGRHAGLDCRVIVTSSAELPAELSRQLQEVFGPPENVTLPPLSPEEIEQWVKAQGLPAWISQKTYQLSAGLPGKLAEAAATAQQGNLDHGKSGKLEPVLARLEKASAELIAQASMLPELSEECVGVLFPERDGKETLASITQAFRHSGILKEGNHSIAPEWRGALAAWLERESPASYRRARDLCEQLQLVFETIGDAELRWALARLSSFNYFNERVLKEVFGQEAPQLLETVARRREYFECSGENRRVARDMLPYVQAYCRLIRFEPAKEEEARIRSAWERSRRTMMDALNNAETEVQRDGAAVERLNAQIQQLNQEIDVVVRGPRQLQKRWRSEDLHACRKRNNMVSVVLQVVGAAVLYFSILLSNRVSLVYSFLGIACIAAGFFLSGRREPQPHLEMGVDEQAWVERLEKNLQLLNLKRRHLMGKHSAMRSELALKQARMDEYKRLLREPYN